MKHRRSRTVSKIHHAPRDESDHSPETGGVAGDSGKIRHTTSGVLENLERMAFGMPKLSTMLSELQPEAGDGLGIYLRSQTVISVAAGSPGPLGSQFATLEKKGSPQ